MTVRRRAVVVLLAALSVVSLSAMFIQIADAQTTTPVPGSQGTDTSLPLTDSAVTVRGRGQFADLAITVNQTKNLTNQAVSITWTGGVADRVQGPGRFAGNYLQIFQCWGDADRYVPDDPGPPPEQCQQGAVAGTYEGLPFGVYPNAFAMTRIVSRSTWSGYDPDYGVREPQGVNVWLPFRAVDGSVVDVQIDPNFNSALVGGNYWQNPYYNVITTNEIAGGATGVDGRGAELMQVLTGIEASGLGCGQKVQPVSGAGTTIPKCWIVVVPRSTADDENVGTPFDSGYGVYTSPLSKDAWKNRVAIPIEFNPVDSPCSLSDDQRRIAGTELALTAIANWQPVLCTIDGLPPYSYVPIGDSDARQQLLSGVSGAPGMVVVGRAISPDRIDPSNPVVYAPVSVSGLAIGFNIERNPTPESPPAEQNLAGVRVADINLTPRLVAKLLTQSYTSQVEIYPSPRLRLACVESSASWLRPRLPAIQSGIRPAPDLEPAQLRRSQPACRKL